MQKEIENLKTLIVEDYHNWSYRSWMASGYDMSRFDAKIEEFENGLEVKEGSKYIKIISDRSVWGFIVKGDNDKLFKKGDVLKPAGWAAPARNKPRGNVFAMLEGKGTGWVRWTGPQYLR